ncbi:hypothetical protein LXL04_028540 [Taraxacum kok-saghyz]
MRIHSRFFTAALGGNPTGAAPQPIQYLQMAQPNGNVSFDEEEPVNPNLQSFEHFLMCENYVFPPLNFTELLQQNDVQSTVDVHPEIMHPTDPFFDQFIFDNAISKEGFQTGPSETCDQRNNSHNTAKNGMNDFGNPIQLSSWPLQVPPYTCSCCHILREIIHTNGADIMKLEIHGRLGLICHGVLDKYNIHVTTNQDHEYKMFDFCKETVSRVKQFLLEYCKERNTGGFAMVQDPLSLFYEAVCVGLVWDDNMGTLDLIPHHSGDHQTNKLDVETSRARLNNKTAYSIQRERTGKLTMKDLVDHFHIPIEVAAKKIEVCPTVIKKICRKHGLSRWPYRKIKSIEKNISTRENCLTSLDAEARIHAQAEISRLRQEIQNIYVGFNV